MSEKIQKMVQQVVGDDLQAAEDTLKDIVDSKIVQRTSEKAKELFDIDPSSETDHEGKDTGDDDE